MAETWDKLFRATVLRGGLLKADDATTLEANYVVANIGQTQMDDRAVMFPKTAIDDALLMAGDQLVRAFAGNPLSPYRRNFHDITPAIASNGLIPTISDGGFPIVGVIGDVYDFVNLDALVRLDTEDEVNTILLLTTIKQQLMYYWTDHVRIVHTRPVTDVHCDVVVWDKEAERAKLNTNPRGQCNFTEDLHEALICGALANIFRSSWNAEQVEVWATYFTKKLAEVSRMGTTEVVSV
jgi:hypothetical protein